MQSHSSLFVVFNYYHRSVLIAVELQARTVFGRQQSVILPRHQHQQRVEKRREDAGDCDHYAEVTTSRRFVILALAPGESIGDQSPYQGPDYRHQRRHYRYQSDILDFQSHLRHVQRKKRKEAAEA